MIAEEIIVGEAAICSAPSRLFSGLCFSDTNCTAICEKEGFLSGMCKRLQCVCSKDCGGGGGGGGGEDGGGDEPPAANYNRKYLIN